MNHQNSEWTEPNVVGLLPYFIKRNDPRPAAEQMADGSGCGWSPLPGMTIMVDGARLSPENKAGMQTGTVTLEYWPNGERQVGEDADPPLKELSRSVVNDQLLIFFECEWLAAISHDCTYEVSRAD